MRDRNIAVAPERSPGKWIVVALACLLAVLPAGCDDDLDDEQASAEFIYQCVDSQADYACVQPGYFDFIVHMGDGVVLSSVALGSQFNPVYGIKDSSSGSHGRA